jgi:hypothetical protein
MCERTVATLNHAKTSVSITDGCRHLKSTPSYIHFTTYIAETKRKYLGLGGAGRLLGERRGAARPEVLRGAGWTTGSGGRRWSTAGAKSCSGRRSSGEGGRRLAGTCEVLLHRIHRGAATARQDGSGNGGGEEHETARRRWGALVGEIRGSEPVASALNVQFLPRAC